MDDPDGSVDVFECRDCGNVGLGSGEIRCCDGPMQQAEARASPVSRPSLEDVLRTVFDMSDTELDVCLCVVEGGELTVNELVEQVDYDRSVVARHLNHLVDLGVLEKRRRLLRRGGDVYVYAPLDPDAVRRNLTELFFRWVVRATPRLAELQRDKVEAIVETNSDDPEWQIYR
ncbi:MAG: helix-turn-helix domain-containing protein [Haloferacaceae archaeon]